MALTALPSYWRQEIQACHTALREHLGASYDAMVRGYTGGRWGNGSDEEDENPENHAFEWISLMQGQACPGTPQVKAISADAIGPLAQQATQLELSVNELLVKSKFRREMLKVFIDHGMRYGAVWVAPQPQMGAWQFADPPNWPQAMRLSLKDFVFDVRALDAESLRWLGRRVRMDKEDVLEAARADKSLGWNLPLLEELATVSEAEESSESERPAKRWWGGPDRSQVEFFEIWVPELELEWDGEAKRKFKGRKSWREAGFNGLILTVALGMGDDRPFGAGVTMDQDPWIREPRPFFGPPDGPIEFFRAYDVPDEVIPLSNLTAVQSQVEFLNDLTWAMSESARRWKRLVFVTSEDPDLAVKVTETDHDNVLTTNVSDVKKGIQEVEVGGTTDQQIMSTDMAKNRLDRIAGMDDAQRGNVTGQGTATEVYAAAQASMARSGIIISNFREGMVGVIKKMCWYIWNDHTFQMLLGPEAAARVFNVRTGELKGHGVIKVQGGTMGPDGEPENMAPNFDAVSISIHTFHTTEYGTTSPAQQLLEFDQAAMNYLPLTSDPRFLHVDWAKFFADRRRYVNGPDPTAAVDFELGRTIGMHLLQAQLEAPQAAGAASPQHGQGSKAGGGPGWRVGQPAQKTQGGPTARAGGLLKPQSNSPAKPGGAKKPASPAAAK